MSVRRSSLGKHEEKSIHSILALSRYRGRGTNISCLAIISILSPCMRQVRSDYNSCSWNRCREDLFIPSNWRHCSKINQHLPIIHLAVTGRKRRDAKKNIRLSRMHGTPSKSFVLYFHLRKWFACPDAEVRSADCCRRVRILLFLCILNNINVL